MPEDLAVYKRVKLLQVIAASKVQSEKDRTEKTLDGLKRAWTRMRSGVLASSDRLEREVVHRSIDISKDAFVVGAANGTGHLGHEQAITLADASSLR